MLKPTRPDKQYLSLELKRFYDAKIAPDKLCLSLELIQAAKDRLINDTDFENYGQMSDKLWRTCRSEIGKP